MDTEEVVATAVAVTQAVQPAVMAVGPVEADMVADLAVGMAADLAVDMAVVMVTAHPVDTEPKVAIDQRLVPPDIPVAMDTLTKVTVVTMDRAVVTLDVARTEVPATAAVQPVATVPATDTHLEEVPAVVTHPTVAVTLPHQMTDIARLRVTHRPT